MISRFITLVSLAFFAVGQPAFGRQDPNQEPEDFFAIETELTHGGAKDSFKIYAGSFDTELGAEAFLGFFKSIEAEARLSNPGLHTQADFFEAVGKKDRSPQSLKPGFKRISSRVCEVVKNCVVTPVKNATKNFKAWMKVPGNKLRLSFSIVAGAVDGTSTGLTLMLFDHLSVAAAMTIGSTAAALSASWSMLTPKIAKFLDGNPSLVAKFFRKKKSLAFEGAKLMEGLLKWGLVSFAYVAGISSASVLMDVVEFPGVLRWLGTTAATAAMSIGGYGLLDYGVAVELEKSLSAPNLTAGMQKKALLRAYAIGNTAASVSAVGAIGSILGMGFGDCILYGLVGAGVVNLGRVKMEQIKALFQKNACKRVLQSPHRFEYLGSE